MEFEENKPTSEEDLRRSEAKRLTLQPLHADISPDDPSDSEIGSRHANEPLIGNSGSDIEESASIMQPTQSLLNARLADQPQAKKLFFGIVGGSILFVSLAIIAFVK